MERRKFLTAIIVASLISFKKPVKPVDKRIFYATVPLICHGEWNGKTEYSYCFAMLDNRDILKGTL